MLGENKTRPMKKSAAMALKQRSRGPLNSIICDSFQFIHEASAERRCIHELS